MQYLKLGKRIPEELSFPGFGLMHLPAENSRNNRIGLQQAEAVFLEAGQGGINYADTIYPYYSGQIKVFAGNDISECPRSIKKMVEPEFIQKESAHG